MKPLCVLPLAVMAVLLAGCSPEKSPLPVAESPAASMTAEEASAVAESLSTSTRESEVAGYVGKWTGPEGTALTITPGAGGYEVVIRNLDGPRTFIGTMESDGVHIVRDKVPLVIQKGNGAATGMKWLADKHDCLVVMANEGYCRD